MTNSKIKPGKFEGDLRVEFEFNPAEQFYRVVCWRWGRAWNYKTESYGEPWWYATRGGIVDEPQHEKFFKAKRYERALRYFIHVKGLQLDARTRRIKRDAVASGWNRIA